MLWGDATFVFEIPQDRLAGSRLIIGQTRSAWCTRSTA
jgi:hypothetical protein